MDITLPTDDELSAAVVQFLKDLVKVPENGIWHGLSGFVYPPDNPVIWAKALRLKSEPIMHRYAYEQLQKLPPSARENIRIPKVYRVFQDPDTKTQFLIMEYVQGLDLEDWKDSEGPTLDHELEEYVYDLAAKALSLLMDFPVPRNTIVPGPDENHVIAHPLYRIRTSHFRYDSVGTLQDHYNKYLIRGRRKPDLPLFDFSQERMSFCYGDIHPSNFMYSAKHNCVYVIDFEICSFLPRCFVSYALTCTDDFALDLFRRMGGKDRIDNDTSNVRLLQNLRKVLLFGKYRRQTSPPPGARHIYAEHSLEIQDRPY